MDENLKKDSKVIKFLSPDEIRDREKREEEARKKLMRAEEKRIDIMSFLSSNKENLKNIYIVAEDKDGNRYEELVGETEWILENVALSYEEKVFMNMLKELEELVYRKDED